MRPPIARQTFVITGASSGIGRELALRLGAERASVVLAARSEEGLADAARSVERAGGRAIAVPTDVSDWRQVDRLADAAVKAFGRIDTWVNNAGIALYGDVCEATPDEMRRVIEVNLLGQVYGTRSAVQRMMTNGTGLIINVSSALARRSVPLQAAYCAAKHGVSGFTEAVRLDLKSTCPGIELTEVLPSSVNTPLFDHARSKTGLKPMPIPPVYEPSVVAEAIMRACERPTREVVVGGAGKAFVAAENVSATLLDRYLLWGKRGIRQQQTSEPPVPVDNLDSPVAGAGKTDGAWSEDAKRTSAYTHFLELHPGRKYGLAAAALAGALLAFRRVGA